MRRLLLVVTVALIMAAMVVVTAAPAFAAPGAPKQANSNPFPDDHAYTAKGTNNAYHKTPANQPPFCC